MPFNKSARSYYFRELVANRDFETAGEDLSWREARLIFKGATVAAIVKANRDALEAVYHAERRRMAR
jgi:hypothetical protein